MPEPRHLTRREILLYEIHSSWWAPHVSWPWAQELASRYFAWKSRRKADRYDMAMMEKRRVAERHSNGY